MVTVCPRQLMFSISQVTIFNLENNLMMSKFLIDSNCQSFIKKLWLNRKSKVYLQIWF